MVSRVDSRTEADHRGAEALLYFVSTVHLSNDNSRVHSPSEITYDHENEPDANSSGDDTRFTYDKQERTDTDAHTNTDEATTFSSTLPQPDALSATHPHTQEHAPTHTRSRTPHPFSVGKVGEQAQNEIHTEERPLWSASLPSFESGTHLISPTEKAATTGRSGGVTEVVVNLSDTSPSALDAVVPPHDELSDGTESHTTAPLYQDREQELEGHVDAGVNSTDLQTHRTEPYGTDTMTRENERIHTYKSANESYGDHGYIDRSPQLTSTRLSLSNTNTDEQFGALNLTGSYSEDDSHLQQRRGLYDDVHVSESIDELGIIQQFAERRNGERNRRTSASAAQRGHERAKLKQGGRWSRSHSQGAHAMQNVYGNVHMHTQQQQNQRPSMASRSPSPLLLQSRGVGSMQGIATHPYRVPTADSPHEPYNVKAQRRQMPPIGIQRRYSVDSSGMYSLESKQQRMNTSGRIQRTHTANSSTTTSPTMGPRSETPPVRARSSLAHNRPIHAQSQQHAQARAQPPPGAGMHTQTQQSCMGMMPATGGTTTYATPGSSPSQHQRTASVSSTKRGHGTKTPYAKARGSLGWSVLGVSDFRAKDQKRTNRRVGAKSKVPPSTVAEASMRPAANNASADGNA